MKTSRPFTFILHVISKNNWVTDMTITGIAFKCIGADVKVEEFSYSITQIILDCEDGTDIASHVDMDQINKACFNFAQTVFLEDFNVGNDVGDFSAASDFCQSNIPN